jgi:Holliday junction resolvase
LVIPIGFKESIVRRAARRDDGEREIIDALREAGAYVKQINDDGTFDLLVHHGGRTLLLEVKDGKKPQSKRKLTEAEQKFHNEWPGDNLFIVNSVDEALELLRSP